MTSMKTPGSLARFFVCMAIAFMAALYPAGSLAQSTVTVTGTVTDEQNEPLIGATVMMKGSSVGTSTDIDGAYSLQVPSNAVLVFSYVGYNSIEEKLNGRKVINVSMSADAQLMDEVVVVGYGTQRRGSVTGAVASVKGDEMLQTKSENPQNMLTGRVPGLRVWQKSSEPGTYSNNMDVRGLGAPLVVIDGVPRTVEDFQRLNATDIQDISVLKDASAAIYGVRAANGVLLVTTKGGNAGKVNVTYSGSYTIQKPNKMPKLASAYDAMTIYNEQKWNNINGGSIGFSAEDFEALANGTRRTSDWNDLVFSNTSPQTQHDVSISGGNERNQYYVSFGYFYQEGLFKSGDLNYDKYNVRANITSEIVKGLKFYANLAGMADSRNTPYNSSVDIIRNYWK